MLLRRLSRVAFPVALIALLPSRPAGADLIVDGSTAGDGYGGPVSVQRVQTGFGDNVGGNKGSELDAAYARIQNGKLFLALTGNLEDNFNKLVIFFDSAAGGQNALARDTNSGGSNPVVDPTPFPPDQGMFEKMTEGGATTFDSGFTADYALVLRHGFTGSENRFDVSYAVLGGAASDHLGVFDPTAVNSGTTPTGANSFPIQIGFDNSNEAGVGAGTGMADMSAAAAVETGVEIGISLADLGAPAVGDTIKVTAFINSSNHEYVSNQFLGPLPYPSENLGSDGDSPPVFIEDTTFFDLNDYADNQYFSVVVVPEASAALLTSVPLALVWAIGRLRRRLSLKLHKTSDCQRRNGGETRGRLRSTERRS